MSIYGFRPGPTFRGASRAEMFDSALNQPMNMGATFWDQAKGGTLESFGLGTAIRGAVIPPGDTSQLSGWEQAKRAAETLLPGGVASAIGGAIYRMTDEPSKSLDENEWKASAYYRKDVPWDAAMTEDRAAALAAYHDAKKVREYYAQKRPFTSFFGNLAGQAVDPINYIPVAGPVVEAAAVARAGRVLGRTLTGAGDAAANTAIAGLATREQRGRYGDDVSWQATVSEIATAALIGSAFGTISGAIGARRDARIERGASERLSTLRTTQEARIALNEAIDGVVRGEDVSLSPNGVAGVSRVIAQASRPIDLTPDVFKAQPHRTIDELYAVAPSRQAELDTAARTIGDELGVEYITPGIKGRAKSEAKIARKGYDDASRLTDVVRGGFKVLDPAKADEIIERLAAVYDVLDEGWSRTDAGYIDRKALIRLNDGTVAEIQMWEPHLFDAKEKGGGHDLYDKWAAKEDKSSPEAIALAKEMKRLYSDALASAHSPRDWSSLGGSSGPKVLNRSRQSASSMTPAVLNTSQASTSTQSAPGLSMANALEPSTAGRSSQLTNRIAGSSSRLIDTSTGGPEPLPDGRLEAEGKIGKPEALRDLAKQHGVDLATGDFIEMADIDAMRAMGRLTAEDEAALAAADEAFESAEAYGNSMKAALVCTT